MFGMFGVGFAAVVIILWVRFALGSLKLDVPIESLELSRGRILSTRLLSVGFLVVGLAALASLAPALTSRSIRLLVDPLPLGALFCVPSLIAVHRLRAHLETQGNQAKPMMAWLDRGVVAGWSAVSLGVLWWLLLSLPGHLPL
jgi:hypothetical protein